MTTTDPAEAAFLRAILENPADDTVRLVYADWLDEHAGTLECSRCKGRGAVGWDYVNGVGQPPKVYDCPECTQPTYAPVSNGRKERAEFIRVQIRRAVLERQVVSAGLVNVTSEPSPRERELWSSHRGRPIQHPCQWFDIPGWAILADVGLTKVCWTAPNYEEVVAVISRGFVSAVTCTAAAFLGGECPDCRGHGRHGDFSEAECTSCGGKSGTGKCGTGRTEGLARALFRAHPITAVTLSDREPDRSNHGWSWRKWSTYFRSAGQELIPDALYDYLEGADRWQQLQWHSREAALAALSAACVRLGRGRAGLPALPSGQPAASS